MKRIFIILAFLLWTGSVQALDTLNYAVCDTSLHKDEGYDSLFVDWTVWEAMNRNLTTDNSACIVDFFNDGDSLKTWAALEVNGWTTSDSEYIYMRTPVSERHDGTDSTGFRVTIATADEVITVSDNNVTIEGLSIYQPNAEDGIAFAAVPTAYLKVSHCLLKGSASAFAGLKSFDADATLRAWNNIIYGWGSATLGRGIEISYCTNAWLYNNTIYNCGDAGIYVAATAAGPVIAKNNAVIADASDDDFVGTFAGNDSSDYNCSGDATAPGTHSIKSKAAFDVFSDTTKSAPDLHLKIGSVCIDSATDLSSDPDLPFSDDMDGDTRSATWDIGADEYVPTGPIRRVYKATIKKVIVK